MCNQKKIIPISTYHYLIPNMVVLLTKIKMGKDVVKLVYAQIQDKKKLTSFTSLLPFLVYMNNLIPYFLEQLI
jgi:hypothetical protein